MTVDFRPLHPLFCAEVTHAGQPLDLRRVEDRDTLEALRGGMDRYGVLVFRRQPFTDAEQLAFAERFDGTVQSLIASTAVGKNRLGNARLGDISNLDADGKLFGAGDRRRMYSLANRLWHTDSSFRDPAGRYSMLSARVLPPVSADTEFADMRAAYDALDAETRQQIAGLRTHHSVAYSRQILGFDFSAEEMQQLKGAVQPLVQVNPRTGRKSLYIASHAHRVDGWPVPEGRLLLADLMAQATQPRFVHRHAWQDGDFVIWDNLATLHRGRAYDDVKYVRELRRVTTLDIPLPSAGTDHVFQKTENVVCPLQLLQLLQLTRGPMR